VKASKILVAMAAVATISVGSAQAATIVTQSVGTIYQTTDVDSGTNGNNMDGMRVTANVTLNGVQTSFTAIWGDLPGSPGNDGYVTFFGDNDFYLYVQGSAGANNAWDMNFDYSGGQYRLNSLLFEGNPGNVVFDRTFGGANGTSGSSDGLDFAGFNGYDGTVTGHYSNAVGLNGAAPVGDLFTNFLITWSGSGLSENFYQFSLDADNARTTATTTQPPSVPEPTSMVLLGTGLVGLVSRVRRKRQA
jgi:hypothetical protein